jgi:hypothetical protein
MNIFTVSIKSTKNFYSTAVAWSTENKFPVVAIENLGKKVFVCYQNGTPIYSIFLWDTDSNMALIGFPLSNRSIPYTFRKGGLAFLLKEATPILAEMGYTKIWTTSGTPRIMEALEEEKYLNADPNVNVYIKIL